MAFGCDTCKFEDEDIRGPNCGPCTWGNGGLGTNYEEVREDAPAPAKSTNPKKALGMTKPPMHLVPAAGIVHEAMAFKDGAGKYGPFNWRGDPVDVTTYIAACKRHIDLYFNGQNYTSDTRVHNLGAARACLNIILDAEAQGNLIDDRPPAQDLEALMDQFTKGKGIAA